MPDSSHDKISVKASQLGPPPSMRAIRVMQGAGMRDFLAERIEQIDQHGFTPDHDLGHHPGELALAAASYLNSAIDQLFHKPREPVRQPATWPWEGEAWRPGDARRNLVKAIAIAWATIDRLDAIPPDGPDDPGPDEVPPGNDAAPAGQLAGVVEILPLGRRYLDGLASGAAA